MRRDRLLLLAFLFLLTLGCGDTSSIPEHAAWIGVEVGAETVETGRAFPLTVTRVWRKSGDAAVWDDAALAPLAVQLESRVLHEDEERIQETRHFRAYAFAREAVTVPPVPFGVRSEGVVRTVHASAFTVRPRPALLPATAGPPELPGAPLGEPSSPGVWVGLGLGLVLLLGAALRMTRGRRDSTNALPPPAVEPTPLAAHETALAALARLRTDGGDVAAVTDVVRRYVAARFDVRAPYLPTEEILAAPGIEDGPRLAPLLRLGDRTKFADYVATPDEREAHLENAEAFVRETAEGVAS